MLFHRLEGPDLLLMRGGAPALSFEAILAEVDARRARGGSLTVVFDTAVPAARLYAVELPAVPALRALATAEGMAGPARLELGEELARRCEEGGGSGGEGGGGEGGGGEGDGGESGGGGGGGCEGGGGDGGGGEGGGVCVR